MANHDIPDSCLMRQNADEELLARYLQRKRGQMEASGVAYNEEWLMTIWNTLYKPKPRISNPKVEERNNVFLKKLQMYFLLHPNMGIENSRKWR